MFTMFCLSILLGVLFGGFQYALLKMAIELDISKTLMGTMASVFFAALTVGPLLTGSLADKKGKKSVILMTLAMIIIGAALCITGQTAPMIFIGVATVGMGTGTLESTYTAALSDYDPALAGKNVNLNQAVLSLACCAIPLVLAFLSSQFGFGWRTLYVLCAGSALISSVLVIRTQFKEPHEQIEASAVSDETAHRSLAADWKNPSVILLVLCVFVYIFMENGVAYFADAFISIDLGHEEWAAFVLSLFWLAMAVSRFASGLLYRFEEVLTIGGFAAGACILFCLFKVNLVLPAAVLYFLLGLSFAPIWPFIVGKLNRMFPEDTGKMSGVLLAAGGAGGMISPYLMGVFADHLSVSAGFLMLGVVTLTGLVMYVIVKKG